MNYRHEIVTRRTLLRMLGMGMGLGLSAACSTSRPAGEPSSSPASLPTPASGVQPSPATPTRSAPAMILIPGGSYPIGADDGPPTAQPAHVVTLAPFLIDQFEVTNTQYTDFLNALGVPLVQDAPAGQVTARSFRPEDASRFLEGGEGDEKPELLIALDDSHCRIGIVGGRFIAQPTFEDHPVAETTWRGARDYAYWRGARLPTEAEWEAAARGTAGRLYPWGDSEPTPQHAAFGCS